MTQKRWSLWIAGGLALVLLGGLLLAVQPGEALPEYAAQTGEPCGTCHVSPSGGGIRTPRGLGWIAASKPGAVASLPDALKLLGVHLQQDERSFKAVPGMVVPTPGPLSLQSANASQLSSWLKSYEGN
jgi:hypothetical protein